MSIFWKKIPECGFQLWFKGYYYWNLMAKFVKVRRVLVKTLK